MKKLLICLLALLPLAPWAGELRGISYAPVAGGTRLVLDLSGPTAAKVFSLSAPDRLVVDLSATVLRGALSPPPPGALRTVRTGPQAGGGLRVVFDLAAPVRWQYVTLPAGGGSTRVQIDVLGAAGAPVQGLAQAAVAAKPPSGVAAKPPSGMAAKPPSPIAAKPPSPIAAKPPAPLAAKPSTPVAAKPPAPVAVKAAPPAAAPVKRATSPRVVTVVIDAGHGGHDVGAIGPGRLYEKTVTLAIARELAAQINAQRGMRAVLTRSDDRFLELRQRTAVAHKHKADLFLSIHADAVAKGTARGSSVYALSENGASSEAARLLAARENAAGMPPGLANAGHDRMLRSVLLDLSQNATNEASLRLGDRLLDRIADVNKLHRSDVQQAGFMVLKSPEVPSVLVETAFISNPEEARKLADPQFRRRLSSALVAGVRDYLQTEPRLRQALAAAQTGRAPALRRPDDGG